jgi:hypothetical protein
VTMRTVPCDPTRCIPCNETTGELTCCAPGSFVVYRSLLLFPNSP